MLAALARWIGFLTMTTGVVGALLLTGGFFWFAWQIPSEDLSDAYSARNCASASALVE